MTRYLLTFIAGAAAGIGAIAASAEAHHRHELREAARLDRRDDLAAKRTPGGRRYYHPADPEHPAWGEANNR